MKEVRIEITCLCHECDVRGLELECPFCHGKGIVRTMISLEDLARLLKELPS